MFAASSSSWNWDFGNYQALHGGELPVHLVIGLIILQGLGVNQGAELGVPRGLELWGWHQKGQKKCAELGKCSAAALQGFGHLSSSESSELTLEEFEMILQHLAHPSPEDSEISGVNLQFRGPAIPSLSQDCSHSQHSLHLRAILLLGLLLYS